MSPAGSARQTRQRFAWALAFAAVAGLSAPVFALFAGPWVGYPEAQCLHALLLTAVAPAIYADSARRALASVALSGGLAWLALLIAPGALATSVAAPFIFGLARSGVASPRSLPRGLAIEVSLAVVGVALAAPLYGTGPVADALAVWCFFLVQSVHQAQGPARPATAVGHDPFVAARSAAERVMGRW